MSTIKIPLKFTDRLRSRPGSARHCVIATAAQRQWGGTWTVTPAGVEHVSGSGRSMRWRPSAGAYLVMLLFDLGLPVPARSVRLVRGKPVPSRRVRRARLAAAGATAGAVLLLVVSGLAWVLFAIIGAAIAVLGVLTAVRLRAGQRPPVLARTARPQPATTRAVNAYRPGEPAGLAPVITMPGRPEPELEPVQAAVPKAAAPVISEPAPQLAGVTSRQPERSDA